MAPTLLSLPAEILMQIVEDVLFYERPPVQIVSRLSDPEHPRREYAWQPQDPSSYVAFPALLSDMQWQTLTALRAFRPSILSVSSRLRRIAIDRILHSPRSSDTYKVEILITDVTSAVVTWLQVPPCTFLKGKSLFSSILQHRPGQSQAKLIINACVDVDLFKLVFDKFDAFDDFSQVLSQQVLEFMKRFLAYGLKGDKYKTDTSGQPTNVLDETCFQGAKLRRRYGPGTVLLNDLTAYGFISLHDVEKKNPNAYNRKRFYYSGAWDLVTINCIIPSRIESGPAYSQASRISSTWMQYSEDDPRNFPSENVCVALGNIISEALISAFKENDFYELLLIYVGHIELEADGVLQTEVSPVDCLKKLESFGGTVNGMLKPRRGFAGWKRKLLKHRRMNGFEV